MSSWPITSFLKLYLTKIVEFPVDVFKFQRRLHLIKVIPILHYDSIKTYILPIGLSYLIRYLDDSGKLDLFDISLTKRDSIDEI